MSDERQALFPHRPAHSPESQPGASPENKPGPERMDAAASQRQGAREVDPAGPVRPASQACRRRSGKQPFYPVCLRVSTCPRGCPISADIYLVLDLSEDLNRAMRQLRRKLDACEKCPLDDLCGFRRAFQERVDAIIHEVNAEWGMP